MRRVGNASRALSTSAHAEPGCRARVVADATSLEVSMDGFYSPGPIQPRSCGSAQTLWVSEDRQHDQPDVKEDQPEMESIETSQLS